MYGSFFLSELKKWLRDPMMSFMVFYPILFGILGRYILPMVARTSDFSLDLYADFIVVSLTLMTPLVYGAIMGFSILEDRDDHILTSVKVTPLSIHQFLSFRITMVLLFSFAACAYVMWFSDIGGMPLKDILAIAFLACLTSPVTGLLITALSKNKIEGFAIMKGLGTVTVLPVVSLFFVDARELFFAAVPGFWPAKVISSVIRGGGLYLTYRQYYGIGLAYVVLLVALVYRVFMRRLRT